MTKARAATAKAGTGRGRAATVQRLGAERVGGQRNWRAVAYAPTTAHPNGRVRFKDTATGAWIFRLPDAANGQTLDELFEQVEKGLDAQVLLGRDGTRNMNTLADRYYAWLIAGNRSDTYLINVRCMVDLWVLRHPLPDGTLMAALPVARWSAEHTQAIIGRAREKGLSDARVENIGTALSGLRHTAHRKVDGARWLSLADNPMESVRYGSSSKVAGQHKNFVAPSSRPSDDQVDAAVAAAVIRGKAIGAPWLPLHVQIATRCGLRLGEQLALRAKDVRLEDHQLDVNGAWCQPRSDRGSYRKSTKTGESRVVPYPGSMHDALAARVAELKPNDWLLPRPDTGKPWTREAWNSEWHRVRRLTKTWPKAIPFRNARHYTATWWHRHGNPWEDVAAWLGHDVQTCLDHYVRQADDASARARAILDAL